MDVSGNGFSLLSIPGQLLRLSKHPAQSKSSRGKSHRIFIAVSVIRYVKASVKTFLTVAPWRDDQIQTPPRVPVHSGHPSASSLALGNAPIET